MLESWDTTHTCTQSHSTHAQTPALCGLNPCVTLQLCALGQVISCVGASVSSSAPPRCDRSVVHAQCLEGAQDAACPELSGPEHLLFPCFVKNTPHGT